MCVMAGLAAHPAADWCAGVIEEQGTRHQHVAAEAGALVEVEEQRGRILESGVLDQARGIRPRPTEIFEHSAEYVGFTVAQDSACSAV